MPELNSDYTNSGVFLQHGEIVLVRTSSIGFPITTFGNYNTTLIHFLFLYSAKEGITFSGIVS